MSKAAVVMMVCLGMAAEAWAQQPVTVTTSSEFQRGNDEGLTSPAQDRLTRGPISNGSLGSWTGGTDLPEARYSNTAVVHGGFVYTMGGFTEFFDLPTVVRYAALNADGSVGDWGATTDLPAGRAMHSSVAYNGFVYVLGGNEEGFSPVADVYVAAINADGTLGGWNPTTSLPSARFGQATVAYNGYIYSVGGASPGPTAIAEVLVAPVRADGSIGDWTATTELPSARLWHSCAAYNGFLYAVGGYNDNSMTSVLVAPINADGTVGNWSDAVSLPGGRYAHSGFAHAGFLYAIAGTDGNGPVSDSVVAAINADGSLGDWAAASGLPSPSVGHPSVVFNGFAYAFGGLDENSAPMVAVRIAAIEPDGANANQQPALLRGAYSHLVDLQGDAANRYVILNGFLAEGAVLRLQARVAPDATGIFGAETVIDPAPLGTPIQIPGGGRHVWIRVTLDDTGASDPLDPSYLSDITVTPTEPPGAGAVHDGPGSDIDTQTGTSMIEANWTGFTATPGDPISFYEWAIGTAPGLTNVQGWTNVGPATSATNSSLSLGAGMKFVSVRATSLSGLTSAVATSDGVQVLPPGAATEDGDDSKRRCSSSAGARPGAVLVLLLALVLAKAILVRRA